MIYFVKIIQHKILYPYTNWCNYSIKSFTIINPLELIITKDMIMFVPLVSLKGEVNVVVFT